jgi:hypothetical protein
LVPAAKVRFRNAAMGLTLEAATNTEEFMFRRPCVRVSTLLRWRPVGLSARLGVCS